MRFSKKAYGKNLFVNERLPKSEKPGAINTCHMRPSSL